MAIRVSVKQSQNEYKVSAVLAQNTYFVNENVEKGLKVGFIGQLDSNGKLSYATTGCQGGQMGLIFDSSAKDPYGSLNFNDNLFLMKRGNREDLAMPLMRYGVIELSDSTKTKSSFFAASDVTFTASTVDKITAAEIKAAGIVVGCSVISIAGVEHVVTGVDGTGAALLANIQKTAGTGAAATFAAGTSIIVKGTIGYPVYAAKLPNDTNGRPSAYGVDLPFSMIGGTGVEPIGFVESPIAIRFDFRAPRKYSVSAVASVATPAQKAYDEAQYVLQNTAIPANLK